jgi:hypothetical protein
LAIELMVWVEASPMTEKKGWQWSIACGGLSSMGGGCGWR